jgi:hypothetical protein
MVLTSLECAAGGVVLRCKVLWFLWLREGFRERAIAMSRLTEIRERVWQIYTS